MSALLDPPDADTITPHDQRRAQILAAARVCFATAGFHGASMQRICSAAKMSPGALYRYFPSKDAIVEAIAEEERVAAGACMAALDGEGTLLDRMTAVAMEYLRGSRDEHTGGLMVEICSESLRNTAVGKRFHEIETVVRDAFHQTLRRAQDMGELDPSIDLKLLLTVLFAIGDGLMMRLQMDRDVDIDHLEPYLRRTLAGLLDVDTAIMPREPPEPGPMR